MQAVAKAPVAVALDAYCNDFQSYGGGILTTSCSTPSKACSRQLDHAVTIVGYGTDADTGVRVTAVRGRLDGGWEGALVVLAGNGDVRLIRWMCAVTLSLGTGLRGLVVSDDNFTWTEAGLDPNVSTRLPAETHGVETDDLCAATLSLGAGLDYWIIKNSCKWFGGQGLLE